MSLTPYSGDTDYISNLDDQPNDNGGLTADQLKAMFDKFGTEFKAWFNATHIGEVGTSLTALDSDVTTLETSVSGLQTSLAALQAIVTAITPTTPVEHAIPFDNGVVATPGKKNKYWKDAFNQVSGILFYRKSGASDDIANGTQICTLPAGYRPSETASFHNRVFRSNNTYMDADFLLNTNGTITVYLPEAVLHTSGFLTFSFVAGN